MSMVVPDASKVRMQKIWTLEAAPGTLKIRLFQSNTTITHATVKADFAEATFSGYAAINLATPVTSGTLDAGARAVTLWDLVSWTKSGATGNTIYGYWVEDAAANMLWCETFASGSFAMTADGTVLQLYPTLTSRSQYSNT